MGEIAELMLTGRLCKTCGMYLDGEPQGFPENCESCELEEEEEQSE